MFKKNLVIVSYIFKKYVFEHSYGSFIEYSCPIRFDPTYILPAVNIELSDF